jgi:hypothetical protein
MTISVFKGESHQETHYHLLTEWPDGATDRLCRGTDT